MLRVSWIQARFPYIAATFKVKVGNQAEVSAPDEDENDQEYITFTVAECPEVDSGATYFHVAGPGESDFEADLGQKRRQAMHHPRVMRLEHHEETMIDHARASEEVLISMGLDEAVARRLAATLERNTAANLQDAVLRQP